MSEKSVAEATLIRFPAIDLMRWYVVLNSWGLPDDLPLPVEPAGIRAGTTFAEWKDAHPKRTAAFDALTSILSSEQQSWGWWRFELNKQFGEWREWWTTHHQHAVTINENGEPLKVPA